MDKPLIIEPTEDEIDKIRGYRIEKFFHHDNFCCLLCQYKTLWIEKMNKHLANGRHPWAFPVPVDEQSKAPLSACDESKLEY